jgi:hypothetical protein
MEKAQRIVDTNYEMSLGRIMVSAHCAHLLCLQLINVLLIRHIVWFEGI